MKYIPVIIMLVVFFALLPTGLDRQAKAECYQWKEWASEFQGYYLADWQDQMCKSFGIIINAEVIKTK